MHLFISNLFRQFPFKTVLTRVCGNLSRIFPLKAGSAIILTVYQFIQLFYW